MATLTAEQLEQSADGKTKSILLTFLFNMSTSDDTIHL
jgi:hypothetical protein